MNVLIDCSYLLHYAKHTATALDRYDPETTVPFLFFNSVFMIARHNDTRNLVFCWDSARSHRKRLYPLYKNRGFSGDPDPLLIQISKDTYIAGDKIRQQFLPELGIQNSFLLSGFEADDVIASIVDSNPMESFLLHSPDGDLNQLLSHRVSQYSPAKKEVITAQSFFDKYGIMASRFGEVKAIAGCKSDTVPGATGIGDNTAAKFLTGRLSPTSVKYQKISEFLNTEEHERNKKLVMLPFDNTPEIVLKPFTPIPYGDFTNFCERMSFRSFMRKEFYDKNKFLFK